jgi:alginate O-acetyltransferase complex protein AlgI
MIDNILGHLKSFFTEINSEDVIFTNLSFWIFFTCVYAVFTVIYKQYNRKNLFLFIVSIFFYFKASGLFFMLLLATSTYDFFLAKKIAGSPDETRKKILLTISVLINIGLLCFFKYAYFFTDSYNQIFHTQYKVFNIFAHWGNSFVDGSPFRIDKIILPVGISFYTFKTLSYTIDVYRGKMKPAEHFIDYAFYLSFFPQVLIGPIVKARDFMPQVRQPFQLNKYQFGLALFMILNGLFKKLVFGDFLAANFIDIIYSNPLLFSGFENLFAVIAYSLQVYLDFSGYTDIAIGISLLMGYKLKANFNSPYKAVNVGDFWKRWHISLSSWLQEYLYIPLGGNKKGTIASYIIIVVLTVFISLMLNASWILWFIGSLALVLLILSFVSEAVRKAVNTNINLMITMLLGGLWHGATLNFIIWGGLNGLGLVVYKFWKRISPYEKLKTLPVHFWKVLITFSFITMTRIFFRAEDMNQAREVIDKITMDLKISQVPAIIAHYWKEFAMMTFAFIIHWLPTNTKWQYKKLFIKAPVWAKVSIVILTVMLIYQTMSADPKPPIYFSY